MKKYIRYISLCVLAVASFAAIEILSSQKITARDTGKKISLAYVVSGYNTLPDPDLFSHLIYAFCEFNDANDGVVVANPERLRAISDLKKQNADLKVILGIGGYKKEGFSEMARSAKKRKAFVKNCCDIIRDYNLDGIDLDWEFPGTTAGGHTASPGDAKNYGKVVKALRKSLGKDKWISFYSNNSGKFIDFDVMLPYVNYVNVSGYNLYTPQPGKRLYHQSALYPSSKCGSWYVSRSVARHIELGVPREKILLGIPFFGRGQSPFPSYVEDNDIGRYSPDTVYVWDDDAKVPYYADADGNLVLGFDNERSVRIKSDFIRDNGLAGGFIWNYDGDYDGHTLGRILHDELILPQSE